MNLFFEEPHWLPLLIPAALLFWLTRPATRTLACLRASVVVLCCLALAQPVWQAPRSSGTVVVVADRSLSMPKEALAGEQEIARLMAKDMGTDDLLAVVAFGEGSVVESKPAHGAPGGPALEVGGASSDLADAIDRAVSLIPEGESGRLVVISDGRFTGDSPAGAASRAAARGIPIDHRLLARPETGDLAVEKITAPQSVPLLEGFTVCAFVRSPAALEARYELTRDGVKIAEGGRKLSAGLNRLVFRDRITGQGAASYVLRVVPADPAVADPIPENNTARMLVTAEGKPPVLLITHSIGGGLQKALARGGVEVRVKKPSQANLDLAELSGVSAVILENIAQSELPGAGAQTLAKWVKEGGGGMLMTGGKKSFGPGGYFKGPLDPLLPVSMEMRREHRKMSLAIEVVMDRSGSMSAGLPGGKTKMDMADLGGAQVVDLLSPMDEFGAIAVDTEAHIFVPLGPLTDPQGAAHRVLSIRSEGGGIYIGEALKAAARELHGANAATRHLILFADANDSVEPGNYPALVAAMAADGISISVIGMGTDKDKDANLLKDIAKRGGGTCYFADDPNKIPQLFAEDTFTVARSSFIEEETRVRAASGLSMLTGRPAGEAFPAVGGYNLTYLRDGAVCAVLSDDEFKAPVCAAWRAGAGRVAVYTGEADGNFSGPMGRWSGIGPFLSSLARWVAVQEPRDFAVTQELEDGVCRVRVHLAPDRAAAGFGKTPAVSVLQGMPGREPVATSLDMHWEDADTLVASVPMRGESTTLCSVSLEDGKDGKPLRLQMPPVRQPYPPEYTPQTGGARAGAEALQRLSLWTGGVSRDDLGGVWKDIPRHPRIRNLAPWLLICAAATLLLEVLERRTGLVSAPLAVSAVARWGAKRVLPARGVKDATLKAEVMPASVLAKGVGKAPAAPASPKNPAVATPDSGVLGALGATRRRRGGK